MMTSNHTCPILFAYTRILISEYMYIKVFIAIQGVIPFSPQTGCPDRKVVRNTVFCSLLKLTMVPGSNQAKGM